VNWTVHGHQNWSGAHTDRKWLHECDQHRERERHDRKYRGKFAASMQSEINRLGIVVGRYRGRNQWRMRPHLI